MENLHSFPESEKHDPEPIPQRSLLCILILCAGSQIFPKLCMCACPARGNSNQNAPDRLAKAPTPSRTRTLGMSIQLAAVRFAVVGDEQPPGHELFSPRLGPQRGNAAAVPRYTNGSTPFRNVPSVTPRLVHPTTMDWLLGRIHSDPIVMRFTRIVRRVHTRGLVGAVQISQISELNQILNFMLIYY